MSEAAGNAPSPPTPLLRVERAGRLRDADPFQGRLRAGATALRERQIHILDRFVDLFGILVPTVTQSTPAFLNANLIAA